MRQLTKHWSIWLLASITLGLAPFFPEPHLWGKVKWIAGGAAGMSSMDWFDFLLHGSPWVLLITSLVIKLKYLLFAQPEK